MNTKEFAKKYENNINSCIALKDGRILFTTDNGFKYWVQNKKGTVTEEITEAQYNKAKTHRVTKKNKR